MTHHVYRMDKSGLMKNLVSSGPGGKLQQVSEEAMEVLKKKIGILKHENTESAQKMAAAEKVNKNMKWLKEL